MTKLEMTDTIAFVLGQLAKALRDVKRIEAMDLPEAKRPGELWGESIARTLGGCNGIAFNARLNLEFSIDELKRCIPDDYAEPGQVLGEALNR